MEPSTDPKGVVALLGRRDHPTDAIEDYCLRLRAALAPRGCAMELVRVPWAERGWGHALLGLWRTARGWRGRWVLVQYSALQWSRRGWTLALLVVLAVLRLRGARVAVVFHDPGTFGVRTAAGWAVRAFDGLRRLTQRFVLRCACALAAVSFFTLDISLVRWLPARALKARFLPVGSNLPGVPPPAASSSTGRLPKVAVFGITEPPVSAGEVELLRAALGRARAAAGPFELVVFGRGTKEAEPQLRAALAGSDIALTAHGVLLAEEAARLLASADAQVFVRGGLSTRRGSAIAGICCGLPVVAFQGEETGPPVTEAGVLLVPRGDGEKLGEALARVLTDAELRRTLAERSRRAAREWFSWERIAERLLEALAAADRPSDR